MEKILGTLACASGKAASENCLARRKVVSHGLEDGGLAESNRMQILTRQFGRSQHARWPCRGLLPLPETWPG